MTHYANKVCVVTGAASGIGKAVSLALGRQGAQVIAADVDLAGAEATRNAVQQAGGQAEAHSVDIAVAEQVNTLFEMAYQAYGRIDFAFNIAGVGLLGEVRDLSLEHWQRLVNVNIMGTVHCVHAAYQLMLRQKHGHIVNMASLAGLVGYPTMTPYAMTKSAIVGMSQSLRHEAAAAGIKVSVVCPGFIQSAIYTASPAVNVDGAAVWKRLPFKLMNADHAAEQILRGVERNRGMMVFPAYGRLLWGLYRLSPALMRLTASKTLHDFRQLRSR
ncbi:MAG: SDR family oxidoreductase [Chloroflexi bacterium]|nr:SDR family oxidoreductase [Chloroflexota bacterium]